MSKIIGVTAVRNEAQLLTQTIPSIINQTLKPQIHIVVDDGSTDETPDIIKKLNVNTIKLRTRRSHIRGQNQAYALMKGVDYATKLCPDWKYLIKTDADAKLPSNYLRSMINLFEREKHLGISAGTPINPNGTKISIRLSRASDAAKIYRRECWDDIGGLDAVNAFDSHAIMKARQRGWNVKTHSKTSFIELRSDAKTSISRWIQSGFTRRAQGFNFLHTCLSALKNIKVGYPPIIGPIALILSYLVSPWKQTPNLKRKFVKKFSAQEIQYFLHQLVKST